MKLRFLSPVLALLATTAGLFAGNGSTIRTALTNTGADADARGTLLSVLHKKSSLFAVELDNLAPGQPYRLEVGGVTEAEFAPDRKGRARLRFATPAKGNRLLLDFDPRGKAATILDEDGAVVLQAVISGAGEPLGIAVDERADLVPAAGVKGNASARFKVKKDGRRTFDVTVSGGTGISLRLFVNGLDRGEMLRRGKSSHLSFRSSPSASSSHRLLDFDPRGAKIDLFDGTGAVVFSGTLAAKAKGVTFAKRAARSVLIPATAAAPAGGQAEAKLRINADASKDFSVELEDVPVGAYELLVGDVVRGTINVTARPEGGTQGEIEFTNDEDEDDSNELPLTFDPVGKTLTIRQGATVLFSGTFNPSAKPAKPAPGTPIAAISEALASTGLDPDASGEAEFYREPNGELEFEVEIEDVAIGSYQLFVGGVLRGNIAARVVRNGRVKGKVEFSAGDGDDDSGRSAARGGSGGRGGEDDDNDDENSGSGGGGDDDDTDNDGDGAEDDGRELRLTFDPRGQLIEIKSAAGTFFSHVFGEGSADPGTGGTGGVTVPREITVALISTGADPNATAKAEWELNDRGGESFEVELEDLAVGDYELVVGDTVRGTISVVATDRGTRGKIEFDDEPDVGEQPMVFDPLGQVVTVRNGDTVFFQRTFPARR